MEEQTQLEVGLHDFRKDIDRCIQTAESFKTRISDNEQDSSYLEEKKKMQREISLVYTKLQEAKMWAGKCLEAIGTEFPPEYRDKAE